MDKKQKIAVIGIGLEVSHSKTKEEFWNILANGIDCISPLSEQRKHDIHPYVEGNLMQAAYIDRIDMFDYSFFGITYAEAIKMNPYQKILLQTTWHMFEDAGYSMLDVRGSNCGVYLGISDENDYKNIVYQHEDLFHPSTVIGNLKAITAGRLSYFFDLKGPCLIIDSACASSGMAIHLARQSILQDECDWAIAGGANLFILPEMREKLGVESPDYRSKTFDESADGTGGGEGIALLLLKRLDKAEQNGDYIYAVLEGSAANQDGKTIGIAAPHPVGQSKVMQKAWAEAGISPEELSCLEAHGTGTRLGDYVELQAVRMAFQPYTESTRFCAIGSVKTNLGHTGCAAGAIGSIKMILQLNNCKLAPSLHFHKPNPQIDVSSLPVYVNSELKDWVVERGRKRIGGVNCFGINGSNVHLVFSEYHPSNPRSSSADCFQVFKLSADTPDTLKKLLRIYGKFINITNFDLADICATLQYGRTHFPCSIQITTTDKIDLLKKIEEILKAEEFVYQVNCTEAESKVHGFFRRVPCPGYPFREERCWPGEKLTCDDIKTDEVDFLETIRSYFQEPQITADTDLLDIESDSLILIQLISHLENIYNKKLTYREFIKNSTVRDLLKLFFKEK